MSTAEDMARRLCSPTSRSTLSGFATAKITETFGLHRAPCYNKETVRHLGENLVLRRNFSSTQSTLFGTFAEQDQSQKCSMYSLTGRNGSCGTASTPMASNHGFLSPTADSFGNTFTTRPSTKYYTQYKLQKEMLTCKSRTQNRDCISILQPNTRSALKTANQAKVSRNIHAWTKKSK